MELARRGWAAALLATGLAAVMTGCGADDTGSGGPNTLELPEVQLTGDQEVPPVTTAATGTANASMTGNLLRVTGSFQGLSSDLAEVAGSSAHVHDAPMGQSGPVVFNLQVTPGPDNRSGTFDGEALLDENQLRAFEAGRYYVNVHTANHQAGEIRGQLNADMGAEQPEPLDNTPPGNPGSPGDRVPDTKPTFPELPPQPNPAPPAP